jgi:hypothetical protein
MLSQQAAYNNIIKQITSSRVPVVGNFNVGMISSPSGFSANKCTEFMLVQLAMIGSLDFTKFELVGQPSLPQVHLHHIVLGRDAVPIGFQQPMVCVTSILCHVLSS